MHSNSSPRSSTRAVPHKLYSKLINKINGFPHSRSGNSNKTVARSQLSSITPPTQPQTPAPTLSLKVIAARKNAVAGKQQRADSHGHEHHDYENVLVVPSRSAGSKNRGNGGGGMIPLTGTAAALFSSDKDEFEDEDAEEEEAISKRQYKCSLEDEIFEELEKVAYDEAKLNAALENFDRILSEYNERGLKTKSRSIIAAARDRTAAAASGGINSSSVCKQSANGVPPAKQQPGTTKVDERQATIDRNLEKANTKTYPPNPAKLLHKSKTCSIIESKCILKKSQSGEDSGRSSASSLPNTQHSNASLARSLLNLKDLEEFVFSTRESSLSPITIGSKMERVSVPNNYNTYKVKNSNIISDTDSSKNPLPKICNTTVQFNQAEKRQLPRAKSVFELGNNNSTPSNNHKPASRTNSGSKIPISTSSSRSNSFILPSDSALSLLSVSTVKLQEDDGCSIESPSGDRGKSDKMRSSTSTSSICVRPVTGRIQSAISEMNLRSEPQAYKISKENGDELLNKCLEKGHEILKKVEQLSSSSTTTTTTHHHQQSVHPNGRIKLTVKSSIQSSGGLKTSTSCSSSLRLTTQPDEIDGCYRAKTKPSRSNNATNSTTRKDHISSSAGKTTFAAISKLNLNNDPLHPLHRRHQLDPQKGSVLNKTTSCSTMTATTPVSVTPRSSPSPRSTPSPSSAENRTTNRKQHQPPNNAIVISNRKQKLNSSKNNNNNNTAATQTNSKIFRESVSVSSPSHHVMTTTPRVPPHQNNHSAMEQPKNNLGVKSKNIVKNCISNFENQCSIKSVPRSSTTLKNDPGKVSRFLGPLSVKSNSSGGLHLSSSSIGGGGGALRGGHPKLVKKLSPILPTRSSPLTSWRRSASTISILTIAPPPVLKSPALVKQNKPLLVKSNSCCTASSFLDGSSGNLSDRIESTTNNNPPTKAPPVKHHRNESVTSTRSPTSSPVPVLASAAPVASSPSTPLLTSSKPSTPTPTTTVIVVPPSPLPPSSSPESVDLASRSGHISAELLKLYRDQVVDQGDEEDDDDDAQEEDNDKEEQRVIDHLKCVVHVVENSNNNSVAKKSCLVSSEKEETYQSDCSEDSGHISNENNELEEQQQQQLIAKPIPGKLTESLLEIFEQKCRKNAAESVGLCASSGNSGLYELYNGLANRSLTGSSSRLVTLISETKKLPDKNEAKLTNDLTGISQGELKVVPHHDDDDDGTEEASEDDSIRSSISRCSSQSAIAAECSDDDKNAVATSCDRWTDEIDNHRQQPVECNTEVLFRSGVLNQLEAKRDELLSDRIIQLQAYCRGHLARKRLAQRRIQELAVKCIQRNVRAFLKVREWPWWRLLVRVTPLLNVHRTEEQLKIATTELQMLKEKLDKVENDRTNLKTENSRLEMRLSEMTAELAEEHSSSNLISERLDAETTERLRLEKEVKEHEEKYRHLQESSEKLEMELLCAKSDLNGDLDDDFDGDGDGNAYRIKYERVARELEFTKKRLQTQHEHDLEQLIGLKKQLEKKLADAYEEVEEQRQVVGQWKRKAQKMTNEMNDLRMLLEEQNSRNNLLEKRQRKFDSECQSLQDSARQEKQSKERLTREKDVLIAEKFTLEQTLSDVRLELELKEEKYTALQRELEEMTFGGGTEEEIAQLKRQKMDLDRRCKEQEEELDEMAGQIQLLEQAKLRLEMSLETMRKDARKEAQQRDDELEEVRGSSYKKIKSLECQLEQEHEERTSLLREKHDLERRLSSLEEQDRAERAAEEAASQKLKRDLRKYKALLRDAQSQLERAKTDSAGKALIRQLRNQLEDAESARSTAVKARQVAEGELQDVQLMLEEAQRARFDAEDKAQCALRDRTELQAQIDENEEEMAELMKKYSTTVKQLSSEQAIIADYEFKISELESEKKSLKEQITDLTTRLESVENIGDSSSSIQFKRLELRTKELESRLEFEQATRARMEIQLNRHKDSLEKAQSEISQIRTKEMLAQEALKKAQKTIRELREELHLVVNKEQESLAKRKDLEKRYETVEAEAASARADLRLALQRIADLQQAMEEGDSYHSDSENSDSSIDSVSETSYRSPSVLSSIRGRSGETNGTNGSGTTLCIREEKENTPRIRSKFKIGRITRRRLPFTIKEEEEDESTLRSSLDSKKNLLSDAFHEESDAQIDTVLESIKNAIGEDDDQELNKTDPPPKYTGAIRKVFNTSANKDNSDNLARCPSEMDDKLDVSQKNAFTDENNNDKWLGEKLSESSIVREIGNASTAIAAHVQADDSRFDLDALKSIKEKIRNINRTLKEEANELVSRQKYEFPPPPTLSSPKPDKTNGIIDMTEMIKKPNTPPLTDRLPNDFNESLKKETKPELGSTSSDKLAEGISKLDHIDSQLNVDGIRSIKEKIQQLKRKLQDESGPSTDTVDKNQLISEISEMKKTLTAAFISKGNDHKSTILRSSSLKRSEGSAAPVNERKENHSLTDLVSSAKVPEHAEILPSTSSSKPLFSINQESP
ncbi:uncharacterized protein LOC129747707 isoform X3 [Uranotaenia lowii]|uniref:uncharacterized protein LOC129747707 isoform X3 n=1 Tax=Uranotaenia lowii TaxID=190385 RepID=UPI00247AD269|nr:uncharacterized protein LOC129747707 isoform X3 [Uranotaenia lowii]